MSLDRLRRNFHTGEFPLATSECLDAEIVAALAEGSLDSPARMNALRHVAGCAACRGAVASVVAALGDGPITHEIDVVAGRVPPWWKRRTVRIAVPLAAAAAILVLVAQPRFDTFSHRAGPSQSLAPTPIAPRGTVGGAELLQWTSIPGADRYRVTLFAADGRPLYESEGADTSVALPDSVRLQSGQPYLWKVDARTGWDRWVGSELVNFTIARAPPP